MPSNPDTCQERLSAPNNESKLNEKQRKQLQHELKIYMEKYFKEKLGKGVDHTRIIIWEDMLVVRGEGFLTEPEKYIVETTAGTDEVNRARMRVAKQHSIDNLPYFETVLGAKTLHQTFEVDKDFWMHVIVFDRILTL